MYHCLEINFRKSQLFQASCQSCGKVITGYHGHFQTHTHIQKHTQTDLPWAAVLHKDSQFFVWSDCNSSALCTTQKTKWRSVCLPTGKKTRERGSRKEVKGTNGCSASKRQFHSLINGRKNRNSLKKETERSRNLGKESDRRRDEGDWKRKSKTLESAFFITKIHYIVKLRTPE